MLKFVHKILLLFFFFNSYILFSQDDGLGDIELNQEQWEAVRDLYAVEAIKMLARIDTINLQIDSLKEVLVMIENYDCEKELYALVGATKEEVNGYRLKFEETEKRISGRVGTPDDARKMYYDEVSSSQIRCLPEFSDRYNKMKSVMLGITASWNNDAVKTNEDIYTVVKGDCLWRISETKYKTPYLWPAIWDANMTSIMNPEKFEEYIYTKISDPNNIYPGQVLKLPSVNEEDRKKAEERSREFRKTRTPR